MLIYLEMNQNSLSIVNKSYVTLAKPLRYEHNFVYNRDTYLLLPGGNPKPAATGKLYEVDGDFSKIEIINKDITHMTEFLKRDPEAFKAYALRDAIIILKHATAL